MVAQMDRIESLRPDFFPLPLCYRIRKCYLARRFKLIAKFSQRTVANKMLQRKLPLGKTHSAEIFLDIDVSISLPNQFHTLNRYTPLLVNVNMALSNVIPYCNQSVNYNSTNNDIQKPMLGLSEAYTFGQVRLGQMYFTSLRCPLGLVTLEMKHKGCESQPFDIDSSFLYRDNRVNFLIGG